MLSGPQAVEESKQEITLDTEAGVIRMSGHGSTCLMTKLGRTQLVESTDDIDEKILVNNSALSLGELVKHNGVKETINALRSQYWVPCCRRLTKSVIRECTTCRRMEGKPYSYPPTPPLPESRLNSDFAFKCIALDDAGPIYIRDVYDKSTLNKAWIFLFTCCSSRSIILDLVADCSSSACILGIRRFIGRRWKFNAPSAPWCGVMFERLVRMTKRCLKKALKTSKASYEELRTLLTEIEQDLHIRNNNLSNILDRFRKRFKNEYLTELREYHQSNRSNGCYSVSVNDIVLIESDNYKRQLWKLGRVDELIYSNNGLIRVAKVRYIQENGKSCLVTRPINKLYPMEHSGKEKTLAVYWL
ncbi:uncharacterized protein LOC136082967 [Hydra vulgaris]|uniref:Uncharacterized protein LOC136082967 n=1 Tax=Hydra vulgaris TaxID=6087 RepID=A0ABM4C9Z0_HYDVU